MEGQNNQQRIKQTNINVNELSGKFKSKKELYNFLTQECGAYLPKIDCSNVYFLKDIITGNKEYISRKEIKVAAIPQIEGLTVEDFLVYASKKESILKYLPEEQDQLHIDKRWLCDMLYTLDTEGIQDMVNQAIQNRRSKIEVKQNQVISMRPEFAEALRTSISFSQNRGKAAYLMKNSSKRKRKLKDIEEVKDDYEELKRDKFSYISKSKRMKEDIAEKDSEIAKLKELNYLLQSSDKSEVIRRGGDIDMNQ